MVSRKAISCEWQKCTNDKSVGEFGILARTQTHVHSSLQYTENEKKK